MSAHMLWRCAKKHDNTVARAKRHAQHNQVWRIKDNVMVMVIVMVIVMVMRVGSSCML